MIIGLTGSLASGKGVVADFLKERGFPYFSLSQELREIAQKMGIELTRHNLQDLGNRMREEKGNGYLAEIIFEKIISHNLHDAIIDGIRNPAEILELKKLKSKGFSFFLVSVDAPREVRFERLKSRNRESDPKAWEDFVRIDNRDQGIGEAEGGQQVKKCMEIADFSLINDGELEEFHEELEKIFFLLKGMMNTEKVKFKVKKVKENALTPRYEHEGDAGMDFFSTEKYFLKPGERVLVSTGIQVEFPHGYELQIRPRSGLALKKGISLVNTPGTIDAGYRGEIGIIVINHGKDDFEINPGDKIAQGVLNKIEFAEIEETFDLSDSSRGSGGFGSSGKNIGGEKI